MSRVLPEPMEVDGLTVQKVVVVIEVPLTGAKGEEGEEGEGDSVLEFLLKLQKEQDLMKGYVHAPFRDVIDRLDDTTNTTNDARNAADAKTTLSISRRQIFNWLSPPPPSSSSYQNHHLSKIQQISRTDCGLLWTFLQLPPTTTSPNTTKNHTTTNNNNHTTNTDSDGVEICIMPSWDDAQLTCREVSSWLEELGNLAKRISRRENWGRGVKLVV